jgi:hypothetical protein
LAGIGFLYWADQLDEEHAVLKLMFQFLYIPLLWLSINFAVIDVGLVYGADAELIARLGDFVYYLGWVFFFFGAYLVYNIFMRLKDWFVERKRRREEERYG